MFVQSGFLVSAFTEESQDELNKKQTETRQKLCKHVKHLAKL